MIIEKTKLPGVLVLTPPRFDDKRGHFCEVWNKRVLIKYGITVDFVQDNQSLSRTKHTIRAFHYQSPPHAQDKLVRCISGQLFDVAVDARTGSPTYGQWVGVELSPENRRQLFIPKGFLHGYITRKPNTQILYKCSDYYAPECDGTIRFDDPDIGIDWGIPPDQATLSTKDTNAASFGTFKSPFTYTVL